MDRIRALEGVRVRSFAISFFAYDHPMTRVPQPRGEPGSLKWIQEAIEDRWLSRDQPIIEALGGEQTIRWVSRRVDGAAEGALARPSAVFQPEAPLLAPGVLQSRRLLATCRPLAGGD